MSAHYVKLEPAFRANGCITDGMLGDAAVQVCSARGMAEVMSRIHARHPGELLADDDPLDAKLYEPLCR